MLVYVENGIDCYYCAWVGLNYPLGMTQTDSEFKMRRNPPLRSTLNESMPTSLLFIAPQGRIAIRPYKTNPHTLTPNSCILSPMIGIIGAMTEELEALLENLQNRQDVQHGPFILHSGSLEGKQVLLAQCGIGKVNAAALTQLMILQKVDRIIFTGVAGAVDTSLRVGDIVISTDALQHDSDVRALGYKLGEVPGESFSWQADEGLLELAFTAARTLEGINVIKGRILSGDQFIASVEKVNELRETFQGACAEMEGAAVAQVCSKWNIPFVIIRSMSDSADHDATVNFREFTPLAAARAKQVVRLMLQKIAEG
jgi:adenosylhomocysteine nucleosidase